MAATNSVTSDVRVEDRESEDADKGNLRVFRYFFPLLDALDHPWPGIVVFGGLALETFQLLALALNTTYPWGPIVRGVSIPVYFTVLPFWDQSYFAHASFTINTIFFWILTGVVLFTAALLGVYFVRLQSSRRPALPAFLQWLVYLLIGPFFLPSLHLLLSMLVCDGGFHDTGRQVSMTLTGGRTSPRQYLASFPEKQCFVGASYPLIVFGFAIVSIVLLTLPKALVTLFVYDDHPLTSSPRGRTHSLMEGWLLVFEITSAVLYHYLPAVGQRETFAGLQATGAFLLVCGYCYYMPFFSIPTNRLRVMGLSCVFFTSLVVTVSLALEGKSVLYSGTRDWDALVLVVGWVLMCITGYQTATLRVSRRFLHDLHLAEHGLPLEEGTDCDETEEDSVAYGTPERRRRHRRKWEFPYYLPREERSVLSEEDVFWRPARESMTTTSLMGSTLLGNSGHFGSGSAHRRGSGLAGSDVFSSAATLHEDASIAEDVVLSGFVDSVYTEVDVELAVRFLAHFMRNTALRPSYEAVRFGARIYIKGLSRFVHSDWLKLQYASFLSTYSSPLNPLSNTLCTELADREVGLTTAYRLHRHLRMIDSAHMRRGKMSKRSFQRAVSVHKETLVSVNNFWKQLELDQVGVSQLGDIAFAVMDGCSTGMNSYVRALRQRVDTASLVRYAQFLDHVALDKEGAENMREMAADLMEKRQAGLLSRETPSLALRDSHRPSSMYSRDSRRLRRILVALCILIFVALVVLFVFIYLSHVSDLHLLERTYYGALCRFLTLRTMWTASMAMSGATTSSMWEAVRADLTKLREANAAITYKPDLGLFGELVFIMKRALYVFYYGQTGEYEAMGVWRAGEVYISTLETLVVTDSSTNERSAAYAMFLSNELSGAASAYNATLTVFIDQLNAELANSTIGVTVLFAFALCLLLLILFVIRYHLARISGTRLSVLGLFRLIPRNALKTMIGKMNERIERFDDPDPAFESLLASRGMGKEVEAPAPVQNGWTRTIPSPTSPTGTVAHAGSAERDDGASSGAGFGESHADGATGAARGMDPLVSNAGNSSAAEEGGPTGANVTPPHPATATTGSGNGGDMFAKLARSSSVADVGRIRFHQGQYEAPYKRDAYTPRPVSRDELRERQRAVDDALVDEVLSHVKSAKIARIGPDATLRTRADEDGGGTNRVTENSLSKGRLVPRVSTESYQYTLGVLSVLSIIFGIVVGVLALKKRDLIFLGAESQVPFIQTMQESAFVVSDMFDAAEAAVYYPEDPQSFPNLLTHLDRLRMRDVELTSDIDSQRSEGLTAYIAVFRKNLKLAYRQVLAAAYLSCWAAQEDGADVNCRLFDSLTWSKSDFLPTSQDHIVFDTTMKLPQGKATDVGATGSEKREMARNVMASSYYAYVKAMMHTNFLRAKSTIQREVVNTLSHHVDVNRTIAWLLVTLATLMAACLLAQALIVRLAFPEKKFMALVLTFACLCSFATVGISVALYTSPLPQDGPYHDALNRFGAVEAIYESQYNARENTKQFAFSGVQLGAVSFEAAPNEALDMSWVELLNMMGGVFVARIEVIYNHYQYCRFLETIAVVLGCNYNNMNAGDYADICEIPQLADFDWNIHEEAFGFRTVLQYEGTPQLLYSTRDHDMNVLTTDEQQELAKSLVFGPLRRERYEAMEEQLLDVMQDYVAEKLHITASRYSWQHPLSITLCVLGFALAAMNFFAILLLTLSFTEARHMRAGLRTTAGSSISVSSITDNSFKRLVRRTVVVLTAFAILLIVFYCVCAVGFETGRRNDYLINTVTLRNAHLIESAVNFDGTVANPWYMNTAVYFAKASVFTAESYYLTASMRFDGDVAAAIFGSPNVIFTRYDRGRATNQTVTDFATQSSVLAFGGLVDPSQRRWRHRLMSVSTTDQTMRRDQNTALYPDAFELTELTRGSSRNITNALEAHRKTWFSVEVALYCAVLVAYLLTAWYLLGPLVDRLIKEEEGTQVMLRMISSDIRSTVPAIAEYMNTGRIVQDANIAEVDAMATEFSVLPTIVIDVAGFITYFSRAAEETFLWSAAEAVGQNVNILMPDNVALEHDSYIRRYMQGHVKRVIGTTRVMRAKRKDGSLFPARVQIREVRACETGKTGANNVVAFVGVVRSCEAEVEFERACRLATSLTDSILVPVIVSDTSGVIVKFSKAAEQVFKCTASEVLGRKVNVLMPRTFAEQHDGYMERYRHTEQRKAFNATRFVRGKRLNGETFAAQIILNEVRNGGRDYIIGYLEDLSERLHLEMLAAAGNITKAVSPTPLVIADSEGRMVFCSRSVGRVFGYEPEELTNQPITMLMDEHLAAQHRNFYAAYMRRSRGMARPYRATVTSSSSSSGGGGGVGSPGTGSGSGGGAVGRAVGGGQGKGKAKGKGAARAQNTTADGDGVELARTSVGLARRREPDGSFTSFVARVTIKGFMVEGKGTYVLAFIEDLSAKQLLQTKSVIGRSITRFSAIPVLLINGTGSVVDMNPAAEAALGWSAGEVYGTSVNNFFRSDLTALAANEASALTAVDQRTNGQKDLPAPASDTTGGAGGGGATVSSATSASRAGAGVGGTSPHSPRYTPLNPVDRLLDEYRRTGNSILLGRTVHATAVRKGTHPSQSQLSSRPDVYVSDELSEEDETSAEYQRRSIENTMTLGSVSGTFSPNSHSFPVEVLVKDTQLEEGKHFLVYMRDASHDQRLLEANRWNEAIVTSSAVPVVCASSEDGTIFACSDSLCHELHWPREELVGQHIGVLLAGDADSAGARGSTTARDPSDGFSRSRNLNKLLHALEVARQKSRRGGGGGGALRGGGSRKENPSLHLMGTSGRNMLGETTTIAANEEAVVVTASTRDSEEFPVSVLVQEVSVEGTKPFFIATLRNCTNDMTLSAQRSMSQALADQSPVPFMSMSATGIITEFSQAAEERFGYSAKEIVGQSVRLLMSDGIAARHDGFLRSYAKTKVRRVVDSISSVMARRKDGTFFLAELYVREIVYRAGKSGPDTVEFVSYSCDTTETTHLRRTLKIKEAVAALTYPATIEASTTGTILRFNDLAIEEFGFTTANDAEADQARRWFDTLYDLFPEQIRDQDDFVVQQGAWLTEVVQELEAQSNTEEVVAAATVSAHAATSKEVGEKNGGSSRNPPTVTRDVLGKRRDGSSFRCEVSVTFSDESNDWGRQLLGAQEERGATTWKMGQNSRQTSSTGKHTGTTVTAGAAGIEGGGLLDGADVDSPIPAGNRTPLKRNLLLTVRNLTSDFKLRLQQELIMSTTALLPSPVLQINDDGVVLLANQATEEVLGLTPGDIIGRNVSDILPPDAAQTVSLLLKRYQMTGIKTIADMDPAVHKGFEPLVLRVLRKGGATVRMRVMVREVMSVQGAPTFLCSLTDLSTPVAAEVETGLQEALTRHSPIAILTTDHNGVITECSRRAEELLQCSMVELVGKPVSVVKACPLSLASTRAAQAAEGRDFFTANMTFKEKTASVGSGGKAALTRSVQDQVVITRRDGSTFRARVQIFPILPFSAKVPSYAAYIEDIEQALATEPKSRAASRVLESSPGAVLVINAEGTVERFNAAALRLLHCTPEDLTHLPVSRLVVKRRAPGHAVEGEDDPAVERSVEEAPLLVALHQLTEAARTRGGCGSSEGGTVENELSRTGAQPNMAVRLLDSDDSTIMSVAAVPLRLGDGSGEVIVDATLAVAALDRHGGNHSDSSARSGVTDEGANEDDPLQQRFVVLNMRDVTQLHVTEETERKEVALEDVAFTAVVELDSDATIRHVSASLASRLGYDPATDLVGRPYTHLFIKGDAKVDDFLRVARRSPQAANAVVRQYVFYLHDRNGDTRRKAGEMHATMKPDGSLQSVLVILRLPRSSGSWLSQLGLPTMSLSTEAIMLVTGASDGVVVCANEAARKLFQVPDGASLVGCKLDTVLARGAAAVSRSGKAAGHGPISPTTTTVAGGLFGHLRRHAGGKRRAITLLAVPHTQQSKRAAELGHETQSTGAGVSTEPETTPAQQPQGRESRETTDENRYTHSIMPVTSGSLIPVEVSARELSDDGEGVTHHNHPDEPREPLLLLHLHSILEEQKMTLRKRVIDVALDFAFQATVVVDAAGSITLFSRVAERVFGITAGAARGKDMIGLLLDARSAATMRQVFALFRHRQNSEILSTPRRVWVSVYSPAQDPSMVGPVAETKEAELIVEQMPAGEARSLYEHVAFFTIK